jgi:hypothetical protein
MKESYEKGLAIHSASNPTLTTATLWVWHGLEVHTGQPLSSEITNFACRPCPTKGKATRTVDVFGESLHDAAESETLSMCGNFSHENREIPLVSVRHSIAMCGWTERSENVLHGRLT